MVIVLSVNSGMKYKIDYVLNPHFSIAYRPKKADILTKTQKLGRIDRG